MRGRSLSVLLSAVLGTLMSPPPCGAATEAHSIHGDSPAHGMAATPGPAPAGLQVQVPYGTQKMMVGYFSVPKPAAGTTAAAVKTYPGLVVIHEWWGLNDNIRAVTDKLSQQGYAALAVDLYHGSVATTPDEARALMQKVDRSEAIKVLQGAARWLRNRIEVGGHPVGVVGWCFGGGMALQLAINDPQMSAAVIYYGTPVTDKAQLAKIQAPLLGLFAGEDQGIPVSAVREFEKDAQELGKQVEIHIYPGAHHAFANPSGPNYNSKDAQDAWDRTLAFFNQHLVKAPHP